MANLDNRQEAHEAQVVRAAGLIADAWEDAKVLTEDDMVMHLEALCDLMDDAIDFEDFTETADLVGRERLN